MRLTNLSDLGKLFSLQSHVMRDEHKNFLHNGCKLLTLPAFKCEPQTTQFSTFTQLQM